MKKKSKKRRPAIPSDVKTKLWTTSAGRCGFEGCNKILWRDDLTCREMNIAYIAHIYGWAEGSARYDSVLSPQLEKDFSNLMLMCDVHHRLIDVKKPDDFTPEILIKMKKAHEERIAFLTGIKPDKRSHVVLLGAKIGEHNSPLNFDVAAEAMLPKYYPATPNPIELGLKNSPFKDDADNYWEIEIENLESQFKQKVDFIKAKHEVQHFSIFGLATQPILIKLGTLLSDIYPAEVYQLHREPSTWSWVDEDEDIEHEISAAKGKGSLVALKLELSATITDDRITEVLGEGCDIWSITHPNPNNDYIRNRDNLKNFRKTMRIAFDKIKAQHGQHTKLHVFPAMPVSTAIEMGRVWMPKADLPLVIYDQNRTRNGFYKTIKIN